MKEIISSTHIPEEYQLIHHPSGLDMILYPMEGYNSAYALFATKYGSVDTTFKTDKDADFVTVPEGIAHYLEHKMFESEDGDAFARYAETGASANAFTSFDRTAYLFSCTDNFEGSLEILLDFVTDPYFTPETVQKEQGIIGQEIMMYQDDADWRVMFNMLKAMYHNNPVAIDIAGTVESISHITSDLLYRCYNTFYNLHNMVLVIAGNFSPDSVVAIADKVLKKADPIQIERRVPEEPEGIVQKEVILELPVSQPMFQIGFKKKPRGEKEDFIRSFKTEILLEMIAGETSPFYTRMYEEQLINSNFGSSSESGRGFSHNTLSGESRNPQKVQEEFLKELERVKKEGLDPDTFDHCQKSAWGTVISLYGSVSNVASLLLSTHFVDLGGFDLLDIISNVTLQELEEILHEDFDPELCVLSIVKPKS